MATQKQFFGTAQTVLTTTVSSGACSGAGLFNNTSDSVVPYALQAMATLDVPSFSGVPAATVELWGVLRTTDVTEHDTDPPVDSTNFAGAMFFGEWVIAPVNAAQQRSTVISLEGVEQVDFYVLNKTGVALNSSTTVKIQPFAYGVLV